MLIHFVEFFKKLSGKYLLYLFFFKSQINNKVEKHLCDMFLALRVYQTNVFCSGDSICVGSGGGILKRSAGLELYTGNIENVETLKF